jgi:Prasinovirus putative VV A18 helicase
MIHVEKHNRKIVLSALDDGDVAAIDALTSYRVAGFFMSAAYRSGTWDGKAHLLTVRAQDGAYELPPGLLKNVLDGLKEVGARYKLIDRARYHHKHRKLVWNPALTFRAYQLEAIDAALEAGNGVLKMPTRSGKTRTAARLIWHIGHPTLFVVPSKSLLHQTLKVLREAFPEERIGAIGDGIEEVEDITVALIHSLSKRFKKRWRKRWDVLIIDELHHFGGTGEWHKVVARFDCKHRFGLSATYFPDAESEAERGIIWARALTGPLVIDIPTSRLVDEGFLMKQHVRMYRCRTPTNIAGLKWSETVRREGISVNPWRNRVIALLTKKHVDAGSKVLIVTNRLDQIGMLQEFLDDYGIDYRICVGKTSSQEREDAIDDLVSGRAQVIMGTVIGEGLDIPMANVVVNAEGMKDLKNTIQRQRNLTIAEGKQQAVLIDFFDQTNEYLLKHSKARLATYRSEGAFDVRLVEAK